MRGSLHCATDDESVCCSGRDDECLGWVKLKTKTPRLRRLVSQGAAVGPHFAGGGVDAVGAVHVGFDGFVAAEGAIGFAHGPA